MKSSHILTVGYDPAKLELTVTFYNGATYLYRDVPAHVASEFMGAESLGKYFHAFIRPHYKAVKLPEA